MCSFLVATLGRGLRRCPTDLGVLLCCDTPVSLPGSAAILVVFQQCLSLVGAARLAFRRAVLQGATTEDFGQQLLAIRPQQAAHLVPEQCTTHESYIQHNLACTDNQQTVLLSSAWRPGLPFATAHYGLHLRLRQLP